MLPFGRCRSMCAPAVKAGSSLRGGIGRSRATALDRDPHQRLRSSRRRRSMAVRLADFGISGRLRRPPTHATVMTWLVIQRPGRGSLIGLVHDGMRLLLVGLGLLRHADERPGDARACSRRRPARATRSGRRGRSRSATGRRGRSSTADALVGVLAHALVDEAELELLEAELQVRRRVRTGRRRQGAAPSWRASTRNAPDRSSSPAPAASCTARRRTRPARSRCASENASQSGSSGAGCGPR